MTNGITLPKSVTHSLINLTGVAGCVGSVLALSGTGISTVDAAVICALATAAPIIILELLFLKVHRRASTGLDFALAKTNRYNFGRVGVKLLGLIATFMLIATVYWLFPEYRGGYYDPFYNTAGQVLPLLLILAVPYFTFLDKRMVDPHDSYWHMGLLCLGRWKETDGQKLKEHWLGWTIKGFFLPLMFMFLLDNVGWLINHPPAVQFNDFVGTYFWWLNFAYYIDVVLAVAGYSLTLRFLDAQIRSSHPFVFGWGITLFCYPPFWNMFSDHYLRYGNEIDWLGWLHSHPSVEVLWGTAILVLTLLYAWATSAFGIRFSNLTHRGILTNGPYRFTKHPAYVFKNTSWWLISIPFIPVLGRIEAFRDCVLLLGLNAVYYARAKMEEKHLSSDPVYVQYALWMEEHGIFRPLGKILPFLRYKTPVTA
jgi:protein-S-isoprenylcysteine O-methyltransferase Ste14